jgi:hypothetical protein
MNIANGKSSSAANRKNPFFGILTTLRSSVRWMLRLVILTEEERIQAGIYFGDKNRE